MPGPSQREHLTRRNKYYRIICRFLTWQFRWLHRGTLSWIGNLTGRACSKNEFCFKHNKSLTTKVWNIQVAKLEELGLMWPALTWWTLSITLQIFIEIATTVTPWSNFSKIPQLVSFEAEVPNSESVLLTTTLYCLTQEKKRKDWDYKCRSGWFSV